ncbi:MAG: toll/interleukin-1 receptor domain-containing protein [Muribaculaceae bacterium]|nr:toll/interleukin-1 receptor domain-containing protein [Muribaculaceae bacterium]
MDFLNGIDIFDGLDPEKDKWDALVEAVVKGNVVPVIGPDVLCDFNDDDMNINEFIISSIDRQLHLANKHKTFSQLVYDPEFLSALAKATNSQTITRDSIYVLVNNIFANPRNVVQNFRPSKLLQRLLRLKLFPFVITTSFAPVVEEEMRRVWEGRTLRVLTFSNDPAKDRKPGIGDIPSGDDMTAPTVYYMFGRAPGQHHRYVLTDNDMLDFCKSWMSVQTRPDELCDQLKEKYLLMLGCGYSDWLFRFIWFCMNKTPDTKTKGLMAKDEKTHETLVEYLRRIDTFLPTNKSAEEIVDEIERRVRQYREQHEDDRFARPQKGSDVFISYSRSDSAIAEYLYRFLSEQGLNVWYDRNNLLGGSKFMEEIENAIETTKVFVPIFTHNIQKEAMDAHVYRQEWKKALTIQESVGEGRTFIIPVHEEGFDFYNADIPRGIKAHNSLSFGREMNFSALLDNINGALDRLTKFKG